MAAPTTEGLSPGCKLGAPSRNTGCSTWLVLIIAAAVIGPHGAQVTTVPLHFGSQAYTLSLRRGASSYFSINVPEDCAAGISVALMLPPGGDGSLLISNTELLPGATPLDAKMSERTLDAAVVKVTPADSWFMGTQQDLFLRVDAITDVFCQLSADCLAPTPSWTPSTAPSRNPGTPSPIPFGAGTASTTMIPSSTFCPPTATATPQLSPTLAATTYVALFLGEEVLVASDDTARTVYALPSTRNSSVQNIVLQSRAVTGGFIVSVGSSVPQEFVPWALHSYAVDSRSNEASLPVSLASLACTTTQHCLYVEVIGSGSMWLGLAARAAPPPTTPLATIPQSYRPLVSGVHFALAGVTPAKFVFMADAGRYQLHINGTTCSHESDSLVVYGSPANTDVYSEKRPAYFAAFQPCRTSSAAGPLLRVLLPSSVTRPTLLLHVKRISFTGDYTPLTAHIAVFPVNDASVVLPGSALAYYPDSSHLDYEPLDVISTGNAPEWRGVRAGGIRTFIFTPSSYAYGAGTRSSSGAKGIYRITFSTLQPGARLVVAQSVNAYEGLGQCMSCYLNDNIVAEVVTSSPDCYSAVHVSIQDSEVRLSWFTQVQAGEEDVEFTLAIIKVSDFPPSSIVLDNGSSPAVLGSVIGALVLAVMGIMLFSRCRRRKSSTQASPSLGLEDAPCPAGAWGELRWAPTELPQATPNDMVDVDIQQQQAFQAARVRQIARARRALRMNAVTFAASQAVDVSAVQPSLVDEGGNSAEGANAHHESRLPRDMPGACTGDPSLGSGAHHDENPTFIVQSRRNLRFSAAHRSRVSTMLDPPAQMTASLTRSHDAVVISNVDGDHAFVDGDANRETQEGEDVVAAIYGQMSLDINDTQPQT